MGIHQGAQYCKHIVAALHCVVDGNLAELLTISQTGEPRIVLFGKALEVMGIRLARSRLRQIFAIFDSDDSGCVDPSSGSSRTPSSVATFSGSSSGPFSKSFSGPH